MFSASEGEYTVGSVGKGTCGTVGLRARDLNESGTFASLTKESSAEGQTAVNIL